MRFSAPLLATAFISLAQAQTPSGFTPPVVNKLEVMFNTTVVAVPGQLLSKTITASQPSIALSNNLLVPSETYMFLMLDLDVPPANGTSERRVLLHAMITDFRATRQQVNGTTTMFASQATGPAAYLPPSPPATDTLAHRYVELLFQQPAEFSVLSSEFPNVQSRINFDLGAFAGKNNVSAPIAANFFTVDGRANTNPSGTPTSTGGNAENTLKPFEGAAGRMMLPCGWAASLGAVVLLAM